MAFVLRRTVEQETLYPSISVPPCNYSVMFGSASTSNGEISPRSIYTASDLRNHGCVIGTGRQGRHRYADPLTPKLLDHHLAQMRVVKTPPPMQYSRLHPVACNAFLAFLYCTSKTAASNEAARSGR